jgi:hypothetical protein
LEQDTILSDALLRQLIAVGQVDILVGVPTLNNAATIRDVVRAVQIAFARDFPRLRTAIVNSDGGSTDGTLDLLHTLSLGDSETLLTSHALRTIHRVSAPYHGLPGKRNALRTIFAAAELTQARVVVVVDPNRLSPTPEQVTDLIAPAITQGAEFLSPRYRRHPRDGVLVTQLVRPFVRAVYGETLDEPLAPDFAGTARFAAYCLAQDVWKRDVAQEGIDLWLGTTALAQGFRVGQVSRPSPVGVAASGPRATLREAVQQVVLALFDCLAAHETFWIGRTTIERLPTWGVEGDPPPDPPHWDVQSLADQAREGIRGLQPLLQSVLVPSTLDVLAGAIEAPVLEVADEVWVSAVYEFAGASRRRTMKLEHLAQAFVPLYLARAASFGWQTKDEPAEATEARLEALAETYEQNKPYLIERWTAG